MDMEQQERRIRRAVAATIKAERCARGWTYDDLAVNTDVKAQQIGRYERAERDPRVPELDRIAHAFNLTLAQLFAHAEELATRMDDQEGDEGRSAVAR